MPEDESMGGPGYSLPEGVAEVEVDDVVYVAPVPAGPIRILAGSAAAIWRHARVGDPTTVVERVAQDAGMPADEVRETVEAFLDELVGAGLLTRA